jgi:hypothetical protein
MPTTLPSGAGAAAQGILPRLYVAEPTPSLTGTRADRRIPLHPADLERFARALGGSWDCSTHKAWRPIPPLPRSLHDLRQAGARALVVAGPEQPWAVQALAHAANARLGAMGRTVRYIAPVTRGRHRPHGLAGVAGWRHRGRRGALPGRSRCQPRLPRPRRHGLCGPDAARAGDHPRRVQAATRPVPEARWHLPLLHPLESWGDARAFDGTASLRQPATVPLASALEREQVLGEVWPEMPWKPAKWCANIGGRHRKGATSNPPGTPPSPRVCVRHRGRGPPGAHAPRLGRRLVAAPGLADDGAVCARSGGVGRQLRQQCLAAGTAPPADQAHLGQCRAHRSGNRR